MKNKIGAICAFLRRNVGRVAALALVLGVGSVYAQEGSNPLVLPAFNPETIGADITSVITTYVLPAIGVVLGALFGVRAIKAVFSWVVGLFPSKK